MTVPNLKSFRLIDFHPSDEFVMVAAASAGGKETRKKEFVIQMFGVNEKRETCCLFVQNYQPFFFIHVGDDWTETDAQKFKQHLKNMLIKSRDETSAESIVSVTLIDRAPLYGFAAGRTSKFVDIRFANLAAFNRTKALWYGKDRFGNRCKKALMYEGYSLDLYESNLPPLLRFFHVGEISPSGWVEFDLDKVEEIENRRTTCDYEYVIDCSDLVSLQDKYTAVPYKIASFDIEATSSHGDFPVPVKTYRKLADQVVNGFLIQQAAMNGAVTEENGKKWFRSMVMTAFGFENWSGIDSVFIKPTMVYDAKTKLTKEEVLKKKKVLEWLEALYGVDCSKKESGVGDSSVENVLTLEKAFLNGSGGGDCDGDGEDGEGYVGDDGDRDVVEVGMKIITLLLDNSGKYTREFKVSELNRWMTRILPRLKGDEVSFIGTTFMEYGQTETYLNHCLVVGTCDKVEGVEIVSCDNEKDMLLAWTDLIQKENPDILTGYNIFMFDYDFMFQRAKENQCETPFLMLSRMVGEICSSKRGGGFGGGGEGGAGGSGGEGAVIKEAEEELDDICEESSDGLGLKKTKLVIASGEYDLKYAEIRGRLQVDMFMYFRRDFQLSSYKLDDVAGLYIGDEILEVEDYDCEGEELTGLVTKNIKGLHVNDFIHVHSTEFTTDYLENGKKFEVVDIQDDEERKGKKVVFIRGNGWAEKWASYLASGTLGWGIAKDDVSPQDIFRLTCGTSADRAKVAKYCIQDCNLVHTLFGKMDVLTTYVEMSRICSVPMSFLVFRGQGIKLASYVAKKCRIMGALMPDLEKAGDGADDGYEGAIVLPPKCAMYFDNPVACNDFASLYPSIAEAYNLCPQSLVWTKTFDLEGKQTSFTGCAPPRKTRYGSSGKVGRYGTSGGPELVGEHYDGEKEAGYKYVDVEFDIFEFRRKTPKGKALKTKTGTKICRWAQFPDGKKSIVPAIIHELLTARNDTKAQMKKESDMFMKNVLDKRQLGLKVTANSLYGQFGSKTSPFFQKDVAASITAIGRKMIIYVKGMVEELYSNRLVDVPAVYSEKGYVAGVTMEKMRCRAEYIYGDTDSVFFTFNLEDALTGDKIRGKRALEVSIGLAQEVARLCSIHLPPPMKLAYEKTLMNFCLLSKKRYVGMLYETDPNEGHLKYMGLALKRRDVCDYVKDVYGQLVMIFKEGSSDTIVKACKYLCESLEALVEGRVPMDKLLLSKALRSYYKNPDSIAHAVLAERIAKRDPGNRPKPGDRVRFGVVEWKAMEIKRLLVERNRLLPPEKARKTLMMGDRIETPEFMIDKNLRLDYAYYIEKQLLNPIKQLFGLILEPILEYKGRGREIAGVRRDLEALRETSGNDLEDYMDKREKYCTRRVEELLFSEYMIRIRNRKNGVSELTNYFSIISK
jgi:DNA polymerase elongation subunit (family B)